MSLAARLARLERTAGASTGWVDYVPLTDEEILAAFEDVVGLKPGSLSRSAEEAKAKGHGSIAVEMAVSVGLTPQEFKRQLEEIAVDDDTREYRWVGKGFPRKCQVREVTR